MAKTAVEVTPATTQQLFSKGRTGQLLLQDPQVTHGTAPGLASFTHTQLVQQDYLLTEPGPIRFCNNFY